MLQAALCVHRFHIVALANCRLKMFDLKKSLLSLFGMYRLVFLVIIPQQYSVVAVLQYLHCNSCYNLEMIQSA